MPRHHLSALALVACLALGATSPYADKATVVKQWTKTLDETHVLLRDQQFDRARKRLRELTNDMMVRLGAGEGGNRMFATAIAQLAVAEAGAGEDRAAIWHWQVAQNLHPELREFDLSGYGSAGERLRANVLGPKPETCPKRPAGSPAMMPKKRVDPVYPEGARQLRESGIMIVQVRLDAEGRPIEPHVLKSPTAPLTYSALQALSEWKFDAPKPEDPLANEPFCITVNFKLGSDR